MPIPKATSIIAFEFTPEEYYAATRFTEMNLMLIQTLAANVLEERLSLQIDLSKPLAEANAIFMQQEAALKGQQEAYNQLLMLARDTNLPGESV